MKFFRSIILVVSAAFAACTGGTSQETSLIVSDSTAIAELDWPQGKYLFVDSTGFYYEEWARSDSGTCKGNGYFLTKNGVDTLFCINMKLKKQKDVMVMYYNVKGENEKKDIEFKLTKEDRDFFVFENPVHDFPSIMEYRILGDTAIHIKESGFVMGKEKIRDFLIKKID